MSDNQLLAFGNGCETNNETLDNGCKIAGEPNLSQEKNSKHSLKICEFAKEDYQEHVNEHNKMGESDELNVLYNAKKREKKDSFENIENGMKDNSSAKRRQPDSEGVEEKEGVLFCDCDGDGIEGDHEEMRRVIEQAGQLHRSQSSCNNCGLLQKDPHLFHNDSCFDLKNIQDYFPPVSDMDKVKIGMNDKIGQQMVCSSVSTPVITSSVIVEHQPKKTESVIEDEDELNIPAEIVLRSKKSLQYWVKKFSSILIEHLNKFGVCVIDNFIGEARGTRILKEVLHMEETIPFTVGTLSQDLSNQLVRSDKITWIDAVNPPCPAIRSMLNLVDAIVLMANKTSDNGELGNYKITGRTKAMVACYPGSGSHYIRHVDNPNKDGRCITAIYYLNKNWRKEYGGTLMIYPSKPVGAIANVDPIFDRVIFFWSDRRNPHEVLPAYKRRYAITTWYFDTEEKKEYMKRQKETAKK